MASRPLERRGISMFLKTPPPPPVSSDGSGVSGAWHMDTGMEAIRDEDPVDMCHKSRSRSRGPGEAQETGFWVLIWREMRKCGVIFVAGVKIGLGYAWVEAAVCELDIDWGLSSGAWTVALWLQSWRLKPVTSVVLLEMFQWWYHFLFRATIRLSEWLS